MRPYAERHGADDAAAGLPVEPRAAGGALRRADADPGARRGARAARPIEEKRAELAAVAGLGEVLSAAEVAELRAIGDNTGSMALKGASAEHDGPASSDRWALDEQSAAVAARWRIDPRGDLGRAALARA